MRQPFFFPRDRQFWIFHGSALALGFAVSALMIYFAGYRVASKLLASTVWMPVYTVAVLCFRWLYLRRAWQRLSMGRLVFIAVGYSAVAGIAIGGLVVSLVAPPFIGDVRVQYQALGMSFDPRRYYFDSFVEQAVQSQLFVCIWCFIYTSVTSMRRIRETELQTLRLQNGLKEAQLSSLSNQLNPHFLFNALNNIRFMMHEDVQLADRMTTSLSDILRYSLESSRHDKVSLRRELAIIHQYVDIVKTQLEERMDFAIRIPEQLHGALVPPMVLQMLVENAVKHGLENLQRGGRLAVDLADRGDCLVFEVCNDTPQQAPGKTGGMGIGLQNIERRLKLLYGELAAMLVERSAGQFKVTVTLPKEYAK
ncbi:sensor histidine kinase [Pseudoduganella sp. R-31]|uniref:sensor histidine kinase n=1 Tax=Pseudoduganella sp. R-31 TaxID=3404060 RepID=UPI003CF0425A